MQIDWEQENLFLVFNAAQVIKFCEKLFNTFENEYERNRLISFRGKRDFRSEIYSNQ